MRFWAHCIAPGFPRNLALRRLEVFFHLHLYNSAYRLRLPRLWKLRIQFGLPTRADLWLGTFSVLPLKFGFFEYCNCILLVDLPSDVNSETGTVMISKISCRLNGRFKLARVGSIVLLLPFPCNNSAPIPKLQSFCCVARVQKTHCVSLTNIEGLACDRSINDDWPRGD